MAAMLRACLVCNSAAVLLSAPAREVVRVAAAAITAGIVEYRHRAMLQRAEPEDAGRASAALLTLGRLVLAVLHVGNVEAFVPLARRCAADSGQQVCSAFVARDRSLLTLARACVTEVAEGGVEHIVRLVAALAVAAYFWLCRSGRSGVRTESVGDLLRVIAVAHLQVLVCSLATPLLPEAWRAVGDAASALVAIATVELTRRALLRPGFAPIPSDIQHEVKSQS